LTSSIFIRRKVITERGIFFDTRWRDLGDFHWMLALMKNKVPMKVCDSFTSIFADTGENMNLKPNALREKAETEKMIPPLGPRAEAGLDFASSSAPAGRRTFFVEADQLFHLHAAKPGAARDI
jgi:hypothetical protein